MAHMIMENDNLFSVREVPWHGIATIVQEAPTSIDAIRLAGLDWNVKPVSVGINYKGFKKIDNTFANIREDTGDVLGIVTGKYKILQNSDAFQFMDALLDRGVKYETAGSLENGKRVWMLARLEDYDLLGDTISNYLLLSNSHDGKGAVKVCSTSVRVVCNNTLTIALQDAKRSWSTKHMFNTTMMEKMEEASYSLEMNNRYKKGLEIFANVMSEKKISDTSFENFVETLFPLEKDASDRKKNNVIELRNDLMFRYENAPDLQKFRGNTWGVIQAVSDSIYHKNPQRETPSFEEKRFATVIDGNRLFDKAVELLVA